MCCAAEWEGKELRAIGDRLAAARNDEERVLLATGRYIGEGFDDARLDTLFLTLPVSWLQQSGYFVLRFLAEDVGRNLDMVLDTIQRALVYRQK